MKKNYLRILILNLVIHCFNLPAISQTVYESYQDGVVVFQLKKNSFLSVKSKNRSINVDDVDFVRNLKDFYNIKSLTQLHPNHKNFNLSRTFQINFTKIKLVDQLIENLSAVSEIEYAEKKELHKSFLTPNDPGYTNSTSNGQWALFKINASQAWDLSTGNSNVVVAVTDNAINVNHPDLVNKMLTGYDAVDQDNDPTGCGSNDGFHGSHVSGIVGAETNNNSGIASIGYDVSILPVKIGNCSGSLVAGYEGIIWAADNGADVINMSWGGSGYSNYGQNVCDYAANAGSILVAAAGNDNVSSIFYPAGYNNVISVASTTTNDAKSSFSNYGSWIDISAPGSSILSCNASTGYQVTQGTSMASPLVAGLMGLMKSYAPNASNQDLINCLYSSATNIDGANSSYVNQLGAGRIDAYQALVCLNAFSYALDAAITDVNSPSNSICGTTISPEVTLRNFGSTTLTSVDIVYQAGNNASQTFNWSGSLASGQSVSVTLPSQTFGAGSYSFTASTNNPNGGTDQNASNDQETSNFTIVPNGDNLNVSITTDCYGDEITWLIQDANGNTLVSGGPYTQNSTNQTYNTPVCLTPGCYDFFINDTYGDGMHGSQWNNCSVDGDYNVQNSNGTNLVQMTAPNADFGNGTSHNFCVVNPNITNDASLESVSSPNGPTCSNSVSPIITLANYGSQNLSSLDINYGFNGSAIQTFNWTGNLSSGQTTNVTLPNLTITGNPQSFMVYTSSPNGSSDQNTSNDTITNQVIYFPNSLTLPFSEDFETNSFSTNSWLVENPDNSITWDIVTSSGTTPGNKSAKLNFYQYTQLGQRDRLISSPINFNGYTSLDLSFEHAYRRFDQNSTDSLIVSISTDCGQSFVRLLELGENGTGSFATAYTNTNDFTPSQSSDWCMGSVGASCFSVNLDNYIGNSSVIIKFEGYNAGTNGNNLFIDNININGNPSLIPPTSDFNSSSTNLCVGDIVNFTDLSTPNINSWLWDFGDGNTSTQQNPSHTYTSAGNFSVSLTVNNTVGSNSTTKTNYITINNIDQATIGNIDPVCITNSPITLTSSNSNGVWAGAGISNPSSGTFDPSLVGLGNHNVSFTTNGACPFTDSAVVTVIDQADATISNSGPICILDGVVTLTAVSTGGVWSGNGITDPSNGIFDPSSAGVGAHNITYNISGTCGDNDQITVNVVSFIDPSITPTSQMCSNDPVISLNAASTGGVWSGNGITDPSNGTFDPGLAGGGSHVITYTVSGSCGGTDQETIVVNNALDPTITHIDTICVNNTPIILTAASANGIWSGNGITDPNNGTFAPSIAGIGSHLVQYNIAGLCPTNDQIIIVVEGSIDATIFPNNPICINNGNITLNAASPNGVWAGNGIIDPTNGIFDPSLAGIGSHSISYTISGVCGNSDQTIIQVDDVQNSTINSVNSLCIDNGNITLAAASGGGVWSGNGIIDSQNGIFDPAQAGQGNHVITYAITGYCGSVSTQNISVIENIATFVFPYDTLCSNSGSLTIIPSQQGGIWSGNGINLNGIFDPNIAGSGTHNITYSFSGICPTSHTESVVVLDKIIASINYVEPLCVYDSLINLIGSPSGGTWSGNGILNASNGLFSPSNAGIGMHAVTYVVPGVCGDDDVAYINVDECTNINESSSFFEIYPNPNSGVFTINYHVTNSKNLLEIYNSIGEIVYKDLLFGNGINTIKLNQLESGMYIIKLDKIIKKLVIH